MVLCYIILVYIISYYIEANDKPAYVTDVKYSMSCGVRKGANGVSTNWVTNDTKLVIRTNYTYV